MIVLSTTLIVVINITFVDQVDIVNEVVHENHIRQWVPIWRQRGRVV